MKIRDSRGARAKASQQNIREAQRNQRFQEQRRRAILASRGHQTTTQAPKIEPSAL
jgi:hypothetical protein